MSACARFGLGLFLRVLAFVFCLCMVFGGHHPPVQAQDRSQRPSPISSEDAVQDTNIAAINKHLESTDGNVKETELRLSSIQDQLSEIHGWAVAVVFLSGGSIVIHLVPKRKNQ